jgi:hypothetical protein
MDDRLLMKVPVEVLTVRLNASSKSMLTQTAHKVEVDAAIIDGAFALGLFG